MFNSQNKFLKRKLEEIKAFELKIEGAFKVIYALKEDINIKEKALFAKQLNIEKKEQDIQQIINEKTNGFPWLANAIADYVYLKEDKFVRHLINKKNPAVKAAEAVKQSNIEKKELVKKLEVAENLLRYYEYSFPEIKDFAEESFETLYDELSEESLSNEEDPVLNYIKKEEYKALTTTERNQKALDSYTKRNKNNVEIGKVYERYIGYVYEKQGFRVNYHGIENGLNDLGIDLICTKNTETYFIQCKFWKKHKTIHENHINQLYGTSIKHYLDHKNEFKKLNANTLFPELISAKKITPVLVTTANISERAKDFASVLGVKLETEIEFESGYPMIKCNISSTNQKIYHLPFDLQYDKTRVLENGGLYVKTVEEAEALGFRRAYKWNWDK